MENEMGGACSTHGIDDKLMQKCSCIMKAYRPVVRPERRWGNIIKIYHRVTMYNDMG
jgi:hypothetical protein